MALRKLVAAAAMLALATPSLAFEPAETGASTMFYISIPLDLRLTRKEREQWSAGLQLQGKREYQAIRVDSTMLNFFSLNDIDARLMVAGLVAVGAAVAVSSKDKSSSASRQQQQTQNEQQQSGSCQRPPVDPCR